MKGDLEGRKEDLVRRLEANLEYLLSLLFDDVTCHLIWNRLRLLALILGMNNSLKNVATDWT